MNKIARKFLVKALPDLSNLSKIHYERYFLELGDTSQVRIQSKNDAYELEEVSESTETERTINKKKLTKEEFEVLKQKSVAYIDRDSYFVSDKPAISIKIYHDRFEGLVRAEVDFDSLEESNMFILPEWFGTEITDSPLGKDRKLLKLPRNEFKRLLTS